MSETKKTKHTSGPWQVMNNGRSSLFHVETAAGIPICSIPQNEADANRIVACVNACEGINPEAVPDLLALVKEELAELESASCVDLDDADEPLAERAMKLRAALTKAGAR